MEIIESSAIVVNAVHSEKLHNMEIIESSAIVANAVHSEVVFGRTITTGSGGGGASPSSGEHDDLTGRSELDCHPIMAM